MKKLFVLAILAIAAVSIVPASAGHNARNVSGTIAVPTAEVPTVGLLTRQARCAALLGLPNDVLGHVESLDADEGDGTHTFTLTGSADVDVVFYASLGTCDNAPAAVVTGQFSVAGAGESGTIPLDSTTAIIVFKGAGPNQTFSFDIA